ncbi:MAG: hypothetical protein QOK38_1702 [Acidobacteriaceae bacterium]|jgi:hypothetical protein|nr:hypothetical protein [Acidobacteriaceae bacterium]
MSAPVYEATQVNGKLRKGVLLLFIASFAVCLLSNPTKHPRYTLVLPDGYIGWVQVIVNNPKR